MNVTKTFTKDYATCCNTERYVEGSLPILPFDENQFDLALCSHLLFLYSEQLSFKFHEQAIREMLRVAREVRIFPLITLMLERSPYVHSMVNFLKESGYFPSIQKVGYELQKGGNEMMVIKK